MYVLLHLFKGELPWSQIFSEVKNNDEIFNKKTDNKDDKP
jgi:hypothetical protein